ncbi:MAG: hypothetical protein KA138_00860, partial [Saprospiraceae bacterium]|nr:hypothetical protein [Saprospiraceae bacterium]
MQDQSTYGYQIVPAPNGNFYIAAALDGKTLIALVDKNMEVFWAKSVELAIGGEYINDMRLDSEGQIIGVGNATSAPPQSFAFKINGLTGQLIWLGQMNIPSNSYFTRILENSNASNYMVFGQTDDLVNSSNGCDALLMEVNRNTGESNWDKQYHLGSCEIINDVIIEGNQTYACGRYNLLGGGQSGFRAGLSSFDSLGNFQWSRHYLRTVNEDAQLYASSMVREANGFTIFGWGDDQGISLSAVALQLMHTNSVGEMLWAKKYDILGGTWERAFQILSLPDGYLLCGIYQSADPLLGSEIYIIKTEKDGDYMWGKSYGGPGDDRMADFIQQSDTLYLIGRSRNGLLSDMIIGKMDLNGNVDGQCGYINELDVAVSEYNSPLDVAHTLVPLGNPHDYGIVSMLSDPTDEIINKQVFCGIICDTCETVQIAQTIEFYPGDSVLIGGTFYTQPGTVVDTIPANGTGCDTLITYTLVLDISFLKILGRGNSNESALGVYDAKDGNLYVSGTVGGDSLAIIKMTPSGDIIWSDRINFVDNQTEYISEMIVDDEGMIVGSGTLGLGNLSGGFVFRYNPMTHSMLWAKRIALKCQILGVLQKPNTGNYRIYLNFNDPLGGPNRLLKWDVMKTTGDAILGTVNRYAVDTADIIRNLILDGNKMYACGGYAFQGQGVGGTRHGLSRFDLDGNVEWSRLS